MPRSPRLSNKEENRHDQLQPRLTVRPEGCCSARITAKPPAGFAMSAIGAGVTLARGIAPVEYSAPVLDLLIRTLWLAEQDSADAQEIGGAISAMLVKAAAE